MKSASLSMRLGLAVSIMGALLVLFLAVLAFLALTHELDKLSKDNLSEKMRQIEHSLSLYEKPVDINIKPHVLLDQVMGHDHLNLTIYDLINMRTPLLKSGFGLTDPRAELKAAGAATDKVSYSRSTDDQGRHFLTASRLIRLPNGTNVAVLLSLDCANDEALLSTYLSSTIMALPLLLLLIGPYSKGMGLMSANVFRAEFPCALHGVSDDDAMASIERIFKNDAEPSDIAAIILEPVQGEGGFYAASPAFMQRLRALCDREGIMLIADEVQTGAGRTGTFFAMEQMGVSADITTFAKSIAGGFPLSGITGKAEVMDAIGPGGLGGTYGGNPLACAAALAVLEVFEEEKLLERANAIGERIKSALNTMQVEHPQIADVRGLGAMIAIELMEDGKPAPQYCAQILVEARNRGLILLSCGTYGNVLRILVPLTVPDEQLGAGLGILKACFDAVLKG